MVLVPMSAPDWLAQQSGHSPARPTQEPMLSPQHVPFLGFLLGISCGDTSRGPSACPSKMGRKVGTETVKPLHWEIGSAIGTEQMDTLI